MLAQPTPAAAADRGGAGAGLETPAVRGAYRPPVSGPIERAFDVSQGPYGPGNRGIDYSTLPGEPVGAIGSGIIVFAGSVAGLRWVTVLHDDGLRSSYGPLAEISVARGEVVGPGAALGTAGVSLHLGVRRGDLYLDPATLFGGPRRAHLVPY
ncbi:MAG: M23 family metallopeptidase [Microthrixaceae bacterium]